jgi:hypothetical protein
MIKNTRVIGSAISDASMVVDTCKSLVEGF